MKKIAFTLFLLSLPSVGFSMDKTAVPYRSNQITLPLKVGDRVVKELSDAARHLCDWANRTDRADRRNFEVLKAETHVVIDQPKDYEEDFRLRVGVTCYTKFKNRLGMTTNFERLDSPALYTSRIVKEDGHHYETFSIPYFSAQELVQAYDRVSF